MTVPVFQSRQDLESARAKKEHDARVAEAMKIIYTTKFGSKLIRPSKAANVQIIEMCAHYHSVPIDICVPSPQTMLEIYQTNRAYFQQVFSPSKFIGLREPQPRQEK
jgi:hypothetical protein